LLRLDALYLQVLISYVSFSLGAVVFCLSMRISAVLCE